jgi:hypothetical protein
MADHDPEVPDEHTQAAKVVSGVVPVADVRMHIGKHFEN